MNTDNKEAATFFCHEREVPTCGTQCLDCEVWKALADTKCAMTLQEIYEPIGVIVKGYEQLKQRISQLEQERKEIAEKAWDACWGVSQENGIFYRADIADVEIAKATYLSQFEQSKTEGI